jgi:hypothetical protein
MENDDANVDDPWCTTVDLSLEFRGPSSIQAGNPPAAKYVSTHSGGGVQ